MLLLTVLFLSTLSAAVQAQDFRIVYGSCYRIQEIDAAPELAGIWDEIMKRSPDVFVWGGDTVYGDYETGGAPADKEVLEGLYTRNRALPEYQQFIDSIGEENIVGTWDDHDFGKNNIGKENPYRIGSQEAMLDFYLVPENDARRLREGVYSSHYFANDTVKVILLDIRYHRDMTNDKTGDFLGEEQWDWLESEVNENLLPSVKTTVVVSGIQILPQDGLKTVPIEIWGDFPESKERLLQTLATSRAPNVLLVSGDVHHSEISAVRVRRESEVEYFIPEMTTSGMTHSIADTLGFVASKGMQMFYTINPFSYQYDNLFLIEKNFGEMDFFFEDDDLSKVTYRVFNNEGSLKLETSFLASQLQPSSLGNGTDAVIKPVNDVSGFQRFFFYCVTAAIVIAILAVIIYAVVYVGKRVVRLTSRVAVVAYIEAKDKYNEKEGCFSTPEDSTSL